MPTLSADDHAAITTLWQRYGDAMGNRDGAAAAALYADDCDGVGIDGSFLRGRKDIEAYYKKQFSRAYAKLALSDVQFDPPRAITPDVALINGSWAVRGLKPKAVRVRGTLILRRDPEGWRYVAARFMAALPK